MGSVREGAEAMADAETELGVANEEGVPAKVPAPSESFAQPVTRDTSRTSTSDSSTW